MASRPRVDFIILSWDRADETIAAIDSARSQTGVAGSVIVVDQGSDPGNLARVRAYAAGADDVSLVELGRNLGVAAGRNVATRLGRAPFVVAIDNDAEFADERCALRAIRLLESDPTLAVIAFRILNYDTCEDEDSSWGYPSGLWELRGNSFFTSRFVGAGHAIRRSAFESVGGYDDDLFFACEEIDLGLRLINAGYRIKYDASIRVLHKVSPEARLKWGTGRFYYSVRNRLYIHYKTGSSLWRMARYAAGRLLNASRNGHTRECLLAFRDAAAMSWRYRPDDAQRRLGRLRREARAYVRTVDRLDNHTTWSRLRDALRRRSSSANT